MDTNQVLDIARESIWVLLKVSAPMMIASLAVGLIISLFQALTQIQEVTLTFVPKMIVVFLVIILFLPFILDSLEVFTQHLAEKIISP